MKEWISKRHEQISGKELQPYEKALRLGGLAQGKAKYVNSWVSGKEEGPSQNKKLL